MRDVVSVHVVSKSVLFTVSRPALEPTQPPIQWEPGALWGKAAGAWSWPLTSI